MLDSRRRSAARQAIGPGPRSATGRILSSNWQWLDTCLITYACLPNSCIQFFLLCFYTVFGIPFLLQPQKSVNVPNIAEGFLLRFHSESLPVHDPTQTRIETIDIPSRYFSPLSMLLLCRCSQAQGVYIAPATVVRSTEAQSLIASMPRLSVVFTTSSL